VGTERGTGLAAMFLLLLPGRKRYRAALGLGLVCVLSFTLGCSGYGGGSGGGGLATTTTKLTASMGRWGQARQMPSQSLSLHRERRRTGKCSSLMERTAGLTDQCHQRLRYDQRIRVAGGHAFNKRTLPG